jgi:hypothetical protein
MKTNICLYYSTRSPILDVYNLKNYFAKQGIAYSDFKYDLESGNTTVDSLNSVYNQYFIDNAVTLLSKPLNYTLCIFMLDNEVTILKGNDNIIAAFPAS